MSENSRPSRRRANNLKFKVPSATEIESLMQNHALFAGVKADLWQQMIERARVQRVETQVSILLQGEHSKAVYIVLSGTLKVYCPSHTGSDVVLAICGAGELLGEIGAVDGQLPSANVLTLEPSVLMTIEREVFLDCLRSTPELSLNLAMYAMRRLRAATAHIRLLSRLNATGRIAAQLLVFAQNYGIEVTPGSNQTSPRIQISLRLTQSDLADLTAVSRVRANQVLNELRRDGTIDFDERVITICNRDALIACCC